MNHLSAAGSSATRNLTTTESPKSLNRRKTVNFRFQRPHATSGSFFFNKPMRAMDSRRDFTSKKVFPGYFSELSEKANPPLLMSESINFNSISNMIYGISSMIYGIGASIDISVRSVLRESRPGFPARGHDSESKRGGPNFERPCLGRIAVTRAEN